MQGQALDLAPECRVYRGGMRISELADRVGVPTSRCASTSGSGCSSSPARTGSGYRDYDEDSATRLQFVHRARRIGLSCEQIAELLPVWDGANCSAAQERVGRLLDEKQAEIADASRSWRTSPASSEGPGDARGDPAAGGVPDGPVVLRAGRRRRGRAARARDAPSGQRILTRIRAGSSQSTLASSWRAQKPRFS